MIFFLQLSRKKCNVPVHTLPSLESDVCGGRGRGLDTTNLDKENEIPLSSEKQTVNSE